MTEQMVEALEIEGKTYEVHWYDEEGHGWERRENRRDAFERVLAFLRTHVLAEPATARGPSPSGAAARAAAVRPRDDADRAVRLEHRQADVLDALEALARGSPPAPRSVRHLSSRSAFVEQAAVADEQARLALDGPTQPARPPVSALRHEVERRAGSGPRPGRPTAVVFSPTIEFWTASEMMRMTMSSRIDIWPTSRLPVIRRTTTRNR